MRKLTGVLLIGVAGLVAQACSLGPRRDAEAALFAGLFDVPRGSCRQLKAELEAEIKDLKAAKKKADDAFLAEQEALAKTPKPAARLARPARKGDELAALRDYAKKSERAERWNKALEERRCQTVDLEAALQ
jgi:hypothetical protein